MRVKGIKKGKEDYNKKAMRNKKAAKRKKGRKNYHTQGENMKE